MAWPLSRIQNFIANVTTLTANFFNTVQDGVIGLYQGTGSGGLTVKSVEADGTGAAAKGVEDGAVLGKAVASSLSKRSTSLPNTSTTLARTYLEGHLLANGTFDIDGGGNLVIIEGEGFKSATKNGTGDYTIVTNLTPAHPAEAKAQVTMVNATVNLSPSYVATATGGGEVSVRIKVLDASDTNADCGFCLSVWGA